MALQGKSMRVISSEDFDAIVLSGLSEILTPENALNFGLEFPPADAPSLAAEFGMSESFDRRIEQLLINRKIRDAGFRLEVCRAYDNRCAVTGLRLVNGGGRAEVQAPHIKPVAAGGPDVVQNGIARYATVHALRPTSHFDRRRLSPACVPQSRSRRVEGHIPSGARGFALAKRSATVAVSGVYGASS
jgi:putative restriction endonuclease